MMVLSSVGWSIIGTNGDQVFSSVLGTFNASIPAMTTTSATGVVTMQTTF
jgi:hypothetical protein